MIAGFATSAPNATLIAFADRAAVVSAPALGRRWWAASGTGAFTGKSLANAQRIHVSQVGRLSDASLSYSSLTGWRDRGVRDRFLELTDEVWRTRAYGDFWSYCLLAEGAVDIACEPELSLHDMAALVPVVEEAGGRFTSLEGEPGPFLRLTHDGRLVAIAEPRDGELRPVVVFAPA